MNDLNLTERFLSIPNSRKIIKSTGDGIYDLRIEWYEIGPKSRSNDKALASAIALEDPFCTYTSKQKDFAKSSWIETKYLDGGTIDAHTLPAK